MNARLALAFDLHQRLQFERAVVAAPHACPKCGEQHQVQLINAHHESGPAWKCRKCRHDFHTRAPQL